MAHLLTRVSLFLILISHYKMGQQHTSLSIALHIFKLVITKKQQGTRKKLLKSSSNLLVSIDKHQFKHPTCFKIKEIIIFYLFKHFVGSAALLLLVKRDLRSKSRLPRSPRKVKRSSIGCKDAARRVVMFSCPGGMKNNENRDILSVKNQKHKLKWRHQMRQYCVSICFLMVSRGLRVLWGVLWL